MKSGTLEILRDPRLVQARTQWYAKLRGVFAGEQQEQAFYLRGIQHHMVIMILPDGRRVYEFHPWEKRIRLAPTHIETDVSIWDYLEWLKSQGEDLKEYRSIWYYY